VFRMIRSDEGPVRVPDRIHPLGHVFDGPGIPVDASRFSDERLFCSSI